MEVKRGATPIISFDANPYLKGIEHLSTLYLAIKNKTVLKILYQDFNAPEPYIINLHPYHLKQYNNRWFLFGRNAENNIPNWNLAIDRIIDILESQDAFLSDKNIDWNDYFDDIIGVTKPADEPANIVIHLFQNSGKYIENKPIHGSQRSKWITENTLEVKLHLILNFELERLILSFGEEAMVVEPSYLRDKIIAKLRRSVDLYGA